MLNEIDYRDRRIRAAAKEFAHLNKNRYTIRELPEPIQRGWQRVFALTAHAESRKDRAILEAILPTINTYRACRRLDFKVKVYRTRAMIEIEQSLRRLTDHEFEKAGSPSAWIPYFRWNHYSEWGRPRYIGEFRQPSLFELRVEPRLVWHVKEVDPEIETRIEELDKWMEWSGGWKRYSHQKGKPSAHFKGTTDQRALSLNKAHTELIRSALLDPTEVDPATSTRRLPASLCRRSFSFS